MNVDIIPDSYEVISVGVFPYPERSVLKKHERYFGGLDEIDTWNPFICGVKTGLCIEYVPSPGEFVTDAWGDGALGLVVSADHRECWVLWSN